MCTITKRVTKDKLAKILPGSYAALCGALSLPEPMTVVVFDDSVVKSGALRKALKRVGDLTASSLLFAGQDFTQESRAIADAHGALLLAKRHFGWTDQEHNRVRTLVGSKVKTPDLR